MIQSSGQNRRNRITSSFICCKDVGKKNLKDLVTRDFIRCHLLVAVVAKVIQPSSGPSQRMIRPSLTPV
jgi:hypothetical protein